MNVSPKQALQLFGTFYSVILIPAKISTLAPLPQSYPRFSNEPAQSLVSPNFLIPTYRYRRAGIRNSTKYNTLMLSRLLRKQHRLSVVKTCSGGIGSMFNPCSSSCQKALSNESKKGAFIQRKCGAVNPAFGATTASLSS